MQLQFVSRFVPIFETVRWLEVFYILIICREMIVHELWLS
jgi:hypothetical protein